MVCWQCSIFPDRYQPSIFDDEKLNFRVRNENGWDLLSMITNNGIINMQSILIISVINQHIRNCIIQNILIKPSTYQYQSATCIAALPLLTYQPRCLHGVLLTYVMRYLILRQVSRLDAFSVYLFRTSLPSYAFGNTTGAPQVRPLRSSRTRSSPSQISYAHDGQGPNCLTTF